jgi:hypothetical protein
MKLLFLDDFRVPFDCTYYMYGRGVNVEIYLKKWDIVRNYNDFVKYIETNGLPDLISFDHDLADKHYAPTERYADYNVWSKEVEFKEKTGLDCAIFLKEYCIKNNLKLPEYIIHSMNPAGVRNINNCLEKIVEK